MRSFPAMFLVDSFCVSRKGWDGKQGLPRRWKQHRCIWVWLQKPLSTRVSLITGLD